jgi:hypothetical protein
MVNLQHRKEPFEVEVLPGIVFTVKPPTASDMAEATAAVLNAMDGIKNSADLLAASGFSSPGQYDPSDKSHVSAVYEDLLVKEIVARQTIAWRGVKSETGEADLPFNRKHLPLILSEAFRRSPRGGVQQKRDFLRIWSGLANQLQRMKG